MPPQSGFGMGLERILAILTEQENLRDVVMFPLMKARNQDITSDIPAVQSFLRCGSHASVFGCVWLFGPQG